MKVILLLVCLVFNPLGLFSQSVESVLSRMDEAAPGFKSATAKMVVISYTAILSDTTTQRGTLKMQRPKPNDVRAIIDFSDQPESAQVIGFQGKTIKVYYPNTKEVQEYPLGKDAGVLNQFLLLGFGSSGKDLKASYAISGGTSETIAGKKTTKIQLVPKDAGVKDRLSQAEIWVPDDGAYPLRQKFTEPSGNYRQVTYSDVQINPPMPGLLELKIPSNVTKKKAN